MHTTIKNKLHIILSILFILLILVGIFKLWQKSKVHYIDIPIRYTNGIGKITQIEKIEVFGLSINDVNKENIEYVEIINKEHINKLIMAISTIPLTYVDSCQLPNEDIIASLRFCDRQGNHIFDFTVTLNNKIHDSRNSKTYKPQKKSTDIIKLLKKALQLRQGDGLR